MMHRTIPKGNPPYEHINNQCIVHVISHHLPMQNVYLPTQTIFVLCKSLCINGEFFE